MRNHSSTHTHNLGIFISSGVYIVLGSQYAMHILMKMTRTPRNNTACLRGGILPFPRTLLPSQMSVSILCPEADWPRPAPTLRGVVVINQTKMHLR